jgi:hypothetical protein
LPHRPGKSPTHRVGELRARGSELGGWTKFHQRLSFKPGARSSKPGGWSKEPGRRSGKSRRPGSLVLGCGARATMRRRVRSLWHVQAPQYHVVCESLVAGTDAASPAAVVGRSRPTRARSECRQVAAGSIEGHSDSGFSRSTGSDRFRPGPVSRHLNLLAG